MVQYMKNQCNEGPISLSLFKALGVVYWLDDDRILVSKEQGHPL